MRQDPEARHRDREVEPLFSALDQGSTSPPRDRWNRKIVWALLALAVLALLIATYVL